MRQILAMQIVQWQSGVVQMSRGLFVQRRKPKMRQRRRGDLRQDAQLAKDCNGTRNGHRARGFAIGLVFREMGCLIK